MSAVLAINALFVLVFYKELKITTFDPAHAASVGFPPSSVHYALMTLVALTVVAAYDAAGAVLVVAFIVAPAITAYLLTDRLSLLIALSVLIAVLGAWGGVELAVRADANVAGSVAAVLGALFGVAFLLAPRYGLAAKSIQRAKFAREFECGLLVVHLAHHEETADAAEENRADRLEKHLNWPATRVERVLRRAKRRGYTQQVGPLVVLTDAGRAQAKMWVKPLG